MPKRLEAAEKQIDRNKKYTVEESVPLIKKFATAKFDETVEIHVRLGIDPKKSDQNVRGTISLPNGTGKSKRVVVVAKGEKVKEALAAGADEAGDADIIEKMSKGWMDFDVLVSTPDAMKDLMKLGKVLGPKGLMPNPKSGTVTFDLTKAVKELKAGRIEFKMDSFGVVHSILGKASFSEKNLVENAHAFLDAIQAVKPATAKGQYLRNISLCSTMGPGINIDPESCVTKS